MNIKSDIMGTNILNNQRLFSKKIQESTNRLSTGLRINSASDDSAGLAISTRFQSKIRENEMKNQNLKDHSNMLLTKEGIYQSITDQLQKVRELSIQAQNGTNSNNDIKSIQNEINEILRSIDNMVENGKFNGNKLIKTGVKLDGINDHVIIPNSPTIQIGSGDFSVSLDFKMNNFSTIGNKVNQIIGMWDVSVRGFEIQIHQNGSLEFGIKNGTHKNIIVPNIIKTNEIYKIDMVRENNEVIAYINGEKVNGIIASGNLSTTSPLVIGKEPNGPEYFDGVIGNVKIYDRALNEEDIEKHQMGLNTDSGVVGQWLDNESSGSLVYDETGNGLNGTNMNGATWSNYSSYLGLSNSDVTDNEFIDKLDAALDEIMTERSRIGAYQSKLEMRINNFEQSTIQFNQSNSRIEDADITQVSAELMKEQIQLEISNSMLQKNNEHNGQAVALLRE